MSRHKRNKGRRGSAGQQPERAAPPRSVQIVQGKDFSLRKELDDIIQAASAGEGRIVTVGVLLLFSTGSGDAWVLDVEDNLALCLMRDFERCGTEVQESAENFSIRWESTFAIEEGCFWVTGQPVKADAGPHSPAVMRTKAVAYPTYPVTDLERAIRRARKTAGLS